MEQIMNIVNKAFDDKTEISEQEFRKMVTENKEIQEFAQAVHGSLLNALAILSMPYY
jgi:hypothetical protein